MREYTLIDPETPRYTTRHVADALGVSTNYIRYQVSKGALHASTNLEGEGGRRILRFSLTDVVNYDATAAQRIKYTKRSRRSTAA